MANMSPSLSARLQQDPQAIVKLIVRLREDPSSKEATVQALGLSVRHILALTSSVAVEGPASAALALAREPWVISLEEDRPVHTT